MNVTISQRTPFLNGWSQLLGHRLGLAGLLLFGTIFFFTLFGPSMAGYSYDETQLILKNQAPSLLHWFGTDDLGRDLFTRVWYGARISILVGFVAATIDLCVGVLWGMTAGFVGGRVDEFLMRTADILYSIPHLLVVILLTVVFGSGFLSIVIAITCIGWISMARIVRGQILLIREMEYVAAAKILGASQMRIFLRHLLPNAMGPILVTLAFTIPAAIFAEAFLSFLGIGLQAPIASWGTMAHDGLPAFEYYPWRLFFPAIMMSSTMLSFHLIGEALKDIYTVSRS